MAEEPWLSGLIACATSADAEAVRAGLRARGCRDRSVPTGPAREAWTSATVRGTLGLVVSGVGPAAAAASAGAWVPRARRVVLAGAATGTGVFEAGAVVVEGELALAALARGLPGTRDGRVATVAEPPATHQAIESLAGAGYAAVDGEAAAWLAAGASAGVDVLVCLGLAGDGADGPLASGLRPGQAGPSWWNRALVRTSASRMRAARDTESAIGPAREAAARAALAVLLGVG